MKTKAQPTTFRVSKYKTPKANGKKSMEGAERREERESERERERIERERERERERFQERWGGEKVCFCPIFDLNSQNSIKMGDIGRKDWWLDGWQMID